MPTSWLYPQLTIPMNTELIEGEGILLTSEQLQKDFHYLYPQELPALKSLVEGLPPNPLVVNVGAGAGTSGLAIVESRPDVVLVTIDVQDASSPFGCLEAERDVMQRAGYGIHLNHSWFQICASSVDVGKEWGQFNGPIFEANGAVTSGMRWGRKPDMVFVDGDHSYEGCKGDIEAWFPHLKDGGIMAVHDFLKGDLQADPDGPHPKPWPGVDSAVSELLIPNFEMVLHVASLIAFEKKVY